MANEEKKAPRVEEMLSSFGDIEIKPLSRVQQFLAANLSRNWAAIPHVTHHDEARIDALESFRKEIQARHPDAKLTQLAFLVKALAQLLVEFPLFNASVDIEKDILILKKYVNVSFAVDTPRGLVVAVIRDCVEKTVPHIAGEIAALTKKAREKGLSMAEMSGGGMTISSLGREGGIGFTPIINAHEVAILGVSRILTRPEPSETEGLRWCKLLPLSLSYDHRVINGADAARFMTRLRAILGQPNEFFYSDA